MPVQVTRWLDSVALWPWREIGWSFAALVAAALAGRIVAAILTRILARWARHSASGIDDTVAEHLQTPLRRLLPLFAAMLVATSLPLPESWREPVPHALLVVTIVGVGWLAIRLVRMLVSIVEQQFDVGAEDNLRARTVHTQVRGFRNVASFVIAIVTLSFVLLTFDAVRQVGTGLLASAGIAGIVLGFAAQQSLSTLLAGIQIALTQPIRVDDVVIVEGEWGRIEEIRLTYVVVRVWDLRRLVLPIKYFIEQPFQNWTRTSADLLGTVILHLDYSVPIDELRAKLGDLLEAAPEWDGKTWGMQVTDASEQTMQVRALMSAPDASRAWDLRCRIREGLIAFVRERYPEGLPRRRVELDSPAREAS